MPVNLETGVGVAEAGLVGGLISLPVKIVATRQIEPRVRRPGKLGCERSVGSCMTTHKTLGAGSGGSSEATVCFLVTTYTPPTVSLSLNWTLSVASSARGGVSNTSRFLAPNRTDDKLVSWYGFVSRVREANAMGCTCSRMHACSARTRD